MVLLSKDRMEKENVTAPLLNQKNQSLGHVKSQPTCISSMAGDHQTDEPLILDIPQELNENEDQGDEEDIESVDLENQEPFPSDALVDQSIHLYGEEAEEDMELNNQIYSISPDLVAVDIVLPTLAPSHPIDELRTQPTNTVPSQLADQDKQKEEHASSLSPDKLIEEPGPKIQRTSRRSSRRISSFQQEGQMSQQAPIISEFTKPQERLYRTNSAYPIRLLSGRPLQQIRSFLKFPAIPQLGSGELIYYGVAMEHSLRVAIGAPVGLLSEIVGRKGEREQEFLPRLTHARNIATEWNNVSFVPQTLRAATHLRKRKTETSCVDVTVVASQSSAIVPIKRQRTEGKLPPWGQQFVDADAKWNTGDELVALYAEKNYINSGMFSRDYKLPKPPAFRIAHYSAEGFCFPLPYGFGLGQMIEELDFHLPYDIVQCAMWIRHRRMRDARSAEDFDDAAAIIDLDDVDGSSGKRGPKPAKFRKINSNIFVDWKPTKCSDPSICDCALPEIDEQDGPLTVSDMEDDELESGANKVISRTSSGCGDGCLNRLMFFECDPEVCPCGQYCTNNTMRMRRSVDGLQVFYTGSRGFGLRTPRFIPSNDFVAEYCGEVISQATLEGRMATIYAVEKNYYFLSYAPGYVIDGGTKGAVARFINHSCDPNCRIEKWTVDGIWRIGVFANRNILPGEELTYDYKFEAFGAATQKCCCGAKNCRGVLGNNKRREDMDASLAATNSVTTMTNKSNGSRRNTISQNLDRDFWRYRHRTDLLEGCLKDVAKERVCLREWGRFLPRNVLQVAQGRGILLAGHSNKAPAAGSQSTSGSRSFSKASIANTHANGSAVRSVKGGRTAKSNRSPAKSMNQVIERLRARWV